MFFWVILIAIFILFFIEEVFFLKRLKYQYGQRKSNLSKEYNVRRKEERYFKEEVSRLENDLAGRFLFYDITRKIAPILSKKVLFDVFSEEIRYLGLIKKIEFCDSCENHDYLKFGLGKNNQEVLCVKTKSRSVIEYLPYFAKLLGLCLERIKLYNQLQELSIYDHSTKIYNRRYFMLRFLEEFERVKKFNLNLSFLMMDIDNFKKINDTYGHLVGDAILKEVARLIRENMREIDFVARFGGEEFSAILPETDKTGAIMVAERISSRISQEKIKAFDEAIVTSISVGVASFPQNTLHSDVLIEAADKALYKAKVSGRNRVCWF